MNHTTSVLGGLLAVITGLAATVCQLLRWWRVLQREHYQPSSVLRFVWRWWRRPFRVGAPGLPALAFREVVWCGAVGIGGVTKSPWAMVLMSVGAVLWPWRLGVKGRTAPLAWTRRLRTVAVVSVTWLLLGALLAAATSWRWCLGTVVVGAVPLVVALAARTTEPWEEHLAQRFVTDAAARLARVRPTVVGITGSFGKTSTKQHLAELLGGYLGVVPTPRSFNNRAGLSRAINENLVDGTKVFIAEMGTYGPGEIADLCAWCPPDIAVVTAIGPVHLERMKSLDVIAAAKFEITTHASTVVLNVDDERLASWVPTLRAAGKTVVTASSAAPADVQVLPTGERWEVEVDGRRMGTLLPVTGVRPTNLACAFAAARVLGRSVDELLERASHLSAVPNRLQVVTAPSGVVVVDDTFNANPASARAALAVLTELPVSGRRVLVTPGLVELGPQQVAANESLGAAARAAGVELVTVNATNARALRGGFGSGVRSFATRAEAVAHVRSSLREGDAVLYVNDLPDHYP